MDEEIKYCEIVDDLENYTDSLLFDEHTIARLETENYAVVIEVIGYIRIYFENEIYKSASRYPEELVEMIKSGKVYENPEVDIGNNNWFNIAVYVKNSDGIFEFDNDDVLDIALDNLTKEELKNYMFEFLKNYVEKYIKNIDTENIEMNI